MKYRPVQPPILITLEPQEHEYEHSFVHTGQWTSSEFTKDPGMRCIHDAHHHSAPQRVTGSLLLSTQKGV
eukprot:1157700-Pelagomonas_calceolata.AAC.8